MAVRRVGLEPALTEILHLHMWCTEERQAHAVHTLWTQTIQADLLCQQ